MLELTDIPSKVYEGISFEKGTMPNFDLLSSCFIEQGLFINNKGDSPIVKPVNDYVQMIKTNIDNGNILAIKETELSNEVEVFGNVAQIQSKYELKFEGKQSNQTRYGVNLFQLIKCDEEWLISAMCWDDRADRSLL